LVQIRLTTYTLDTFFFITISFMKSLTESTS
jgi:hypothetical protein